MCKLASKSQAFNECSFLYLDKLKGTCSFLAAEFGILNNSIRIENRPVLSPRGTALPFLFHNENCPSQELPGDPEQTEEAEFHQPTFASQSARCCHDGRCYRKVTTQAVIPTET